MPANTPKGIVYPTLSDLGDDIPASMATLATSVDTLLGDYIPGSDRAVVADIVAGTSTTKVVTAKSLADAGLAGGDTGWVNISTNITVEAGFNKHANFYCEARRVGNMVQFRMGALMKSASNPLPIPTTGNVGNRALISNVPAQFRPGRTAELSAGAGGRANAYVITGAGQVQVVSMVPTTTQGGSVNCPTNEEFNCGGMYFV